MRVVNTVRFESTKGYEQTTLPGLEGVRETVVGMRLTIDPRVPKLIIQVDGALPCVLEGEDIGKLCAWLSEAGYKLPR